MEIVIALLFPILVWDNDYNLTDFLSYSISGSSIYLNQTRRSIQFSGHSDQYLHKFGGISLNYTKGSYTTFKFDLCNVIFCGDQQQLWNGYDVYLCLVATPLPTGTPCPGWGQVWWNTRPNGWIYQLSPSNSLFHFKSKISFHRGSYTSGSTSFNPLTLSLQKLTSGAAAPAYLYLVVGVDLAGKDPVGLIKINLVESSAVSTPLDLTALTSTPRNVTVIKLGLDGQVTQTQTSLSTPTASIAVATGYTDKNTWLDWIAATAASLNMSNCVACSSARPTLFTVPAPLSF